MNSARLPLRGTLLIAAVSILTPLAAQTGFSGIATSGGSPLLNDPRAGEPGTIPAAPAAEVGDLGEPVRQAGFVGRSSASMPDLNADARNYRGLWEMHPDNSVTTPQGAADSRMEP